MKGCASALITWYKTSNATTVIPSWSGMGREIKVFLYHIFHFEGSQWIKYPKIITTNTGAKPVITSQAMLKSIFLIIWFNMVLAFKSSYKILCASPISSQELFEPLRNQIRVKLMNWKVRKIPSTRFHHLLLFFHGLTRFQSLKTTRPKPFKAPQITKFQLAPCHNPPRSMVIIMLMLVVLHFPKEGINLPKI